VTRTRVLSYVAALLCALQATTGWSLAAGEPAPELYASTTAGGGTPVTLASLREGTVLVDWWASWCGPCKQSFPWMNDMQVKYGTRGLRFVAINVDARASDAERFLNATPAKFAVAYDGKGETPKRYEVKAMPTSYLIDPSGRITLIHAGFRDSDRAELDAAFAKALNKGTSP